MILTSADFKHRHTSAAFTLAEVLFAMAIFVFGVLILIGTLPNGMAAMRNARQQAAEARIFQHLQAVYQAELDRTPGKDLAPTLSSLSKPNTFYFDENGEINRTHVNESNTSFAARAVLENGSKLPGESDSSPFLKQLRVAVTNQWQNQASLTDPRLHRQRMLNITITGPVPPASSGNTQESPTGGAQ